MHEELVFPIECRYEQVVWSKYITCKGVIRSASDKYSKYDAMDNISLIPSLVKLVNECKNATDNQRGEVIKKWIKQYGFLTSSDQSSYGWPEENLETFWDKAKKLVSLWNIYRMVTNRDLGGLKKLVLFADTRVPDINGNLVPFGPGITEGSVYPCGAKDGVIVSSGHTLFFNVELDEINKNPLRYYQLVAFSYVKTEVQRELKGISLVSKDMKLEGISDQDFFKTVPIIQANTLLQALYLQSFIILSTPGKKICEGCFRVFVPRRRDQEYCTDTCKNTAKSRRYRARRILQLKKEVD